MNRRFLIQSPAALARALAELSSFPDGPVHEIVLRPYEKLMEPSKQSVLHLMLRALADHSGHTVDELKSLLAQEGEWPLIVKEWRGKSRRFRKPTMDLTAAEAVGLMTAVEKICIAEGVSWGRADNWQDDEGYAA